MRFVLLACACVALLGSTASAAVLNCTVPSENVARSVELCEELRVSLRVRAADWNNDVCATEFLRRGMLEGERRSTQRAANATVSSQVSEAVEGFRSTWPAPTRVECGDDILDEEFGEECDDGNNDNGDGCSNSCGIE